LKLDSLMTHLVFLIVALFSGTCGSIEIIDDDGHLIKLENPAERIISLAPSLTELMFAIGAGDKLKGVIEYSDFPLEAKSLPVIGRFDLLDVEKILELRPDLVIAWKGGSPKSSVEQLKKLGLTVYIAELNDLTSISIQMDKLSKLAGTANEARKSIREFNQTYESLVAEYSHRVAVKTFYQVWNNPLITVGGNELINDIIELCGGSNVFRNIKQIAPKVSVESVLVANPEVIISSGVTTVRPDWLDNWNHWPSLTAVSKQNLFFIPPDLVQRQTPRALVGAKEMCGYIDKAREN
tara:strand:- start:128 stop:1012 length:885 start_codon:yes stop_codon:yes gene_type:complete